MTAAHPFSCALVGYGSWGKTVERYITGSGSFSLDYIVKSSHAGPVRFEQVLADPALDAVFICTPIDTHYELARLSLLHGKHVFCEKPLTKTLTQARALAALAAEKRLCLYTDYIYTMSPSLRFLRTNIERLGRLSYIRGELLQFGNFYAHDTVEEVLGVHLISAVLHLFDAREIPTLLDYYPIHRSGPQVYTSELLLSLSNVPRISLLCSLVSNTRKRNITVYGETGVLVFDPLGEHTVSFTQFERRGYGYVTTSENRLFYDEKNNLSAAVEDFYERASAGGSGNTDLALAVAGTLDRLQEHISSHPF